MNTYTDRRALLLAEAAAKARLLRAAGFYADAPTQLTGDLAKVPLAWADLPIGALAVCPNGGRPEPRFHEVNVPVFVHPVIQACDGFPAEARWMAEKVWAGLYGADIPVHAYLATKGSATASAYALVVERGGERMGEETGLVEASPYEAEFTAAARFLDRCRERGIDDVAVHASPHLAKLAFRQISSRGDHARAFREAYEWGPRVRWVPRRDDAYGYRFAKHLAHAAFDPFAAAA